MRVSGNYIERFVLGTLPFILIGGTIFYIFKKPGIHIVIITMLIMSGIVFIIDKLPLRKSRLSQFNVINSELFIDGRQINTDQIDIIQPYIISPPLSLLTFAVHLKDNTQLNFMDRPKTIFYKSKNELRSKSLDILFQTFPSLKNNLRKQLSKN
ncbi:MAG: hypothetical protein ABIY51_12575 [Ferruginibacter sp.]